MIASPAARTPVRPFFERVLLPHRSLPSRNFHLLMGLLGLISLAAGIGFVAVGAWPVIGFFGLDVALVYLAFRLNYRSARQSETIRLAGDAFTVERVSVRGERRLLAVSALLGQGHPRRAARRIEPAASSPRTAAAW